MGSRQLTGAALTASKIKKRLTALYPKVKFSVRSDIFSGGDSVDIRWTDGPTSDAVHLITREYQHGSYDSMAEIYNYVDIDPSLECEGAKYVQAHRTISKQYEAMLAAKVEEIYGKLDPNNIVYHRKLVEIEEEYFPYPVAEAMPTTAVQQGSSIVAGLEIEIIKDVDTRYDSEIYVVKIITKVADFTSLKQKMKPLGGYYSRFKHGFIFKEDPTNLLIDDAS